MSKVTDGLKKGLQMEYFTNVASNAICATRSTKTICIRGPITHQSGFLPSTQLRLSGTHLTKNLPHYYFFRKVSVLYYVFIIHYYITLGPLHDH